jgi:outer membrane immunogenic protein
MKKLVLAALLAGTITAPAAAQMISTGPFTGPRVEGIVGYDRAQIPGDDSDGVLYGAGVGYDFQTGGAVVGVEGEYTNSTVDECTPNFDVAGDELCARMGRDIYVGARVGTTVGANTLLYAKAGYTNARVRTTYDGPGTALDFDVGENLDGFRVGAGAEFALGPNSFLKTEYRYSNYEQDFAKHQVVAGFGFRF